MKSFYFYSIPLYYGSPPSRGAWIEMVGRRTNPPLGYVAPLAGGVD